MSTEELETWLAGGVETPSFDVKAAMPWDVAKLVKDILAMANVRDGGTILIGVTDSFDRQGITEEMKASYKLDEMRDKTAKYADPRVEFTVSFPKDLSGLEYAAIRVEPFRDLPVICRADGADVHAGVVYYRNTNKRVQSAPISNSYDMRDVILMAVARTREQFKALGIQIDADESSAKKFDDELGGL